MGNENSRESERKRAQASLTGFSSEEKQKFENLYEKVLNGYDEITKDLLKTHLGIGLAEDVITRIFQRMTHTRPSGSARVTEASFYTVIAHLVSCRTDKRAHIIYTLASSTPESGLSAKELFNFVKIVISSYFDLLNIHKKLDSRLWTLPVRVSYSELDLLTYFSLNDLFYPDRKARLSSKTVQSIPDAVYSEEDLLKWCGQPSLFPACFTSTFQTLFPVCDEPERSLLPIFFGKKGMEDHTNLLRVGDVITINQSIPQKLREKWTLLFDSRKHGESFTNLLRNVRKHRNTVLVVRDIEGHIFGGFSTAVWSNHAAFQGSIDNFLFSIHPVLDIYKPSGINTNYFYLNTGQETLPNGMGMGGQLDYFGLWLDCEYGKGHSMAKPLSTTYQSPTLSHVSEFTYTDLEVWRVSNIQEDLDEEAEKAEQGTTSILDSDPGAKALLEMVGKGHHSEGLRESDVAASNPEETELHTA